MNILGKLVSNSIARGFDDALSSGKEPYDVRGAHDVFDLVSKNPKRCQAMAEYARGMAERAEAGGARVKGAGQEAWLALEEAATIAAQDVDSIASSRGF